MPVESPTQRSLKYLRAAGYRVSIAEHWSAFAGRRIDLFGFVDLCAVGHGQLILVQTTTRPNLMARVRKITAERETVKRTRKGVVYDIEQANARRVTAHELLQVPGVVIHVHGWVKGERMRPVIHELQLPDLQPDQELPF